MCFSGSPRGLFFMIKSQNHVNLQNLCLFSDFLPGFESKTMLLPAFHFDVEGDTCGTSIWPLLSICMTILLKHMRYQNPYLVTSDKTLMAHVNKVPSYYYREYTGDYCREYTGVSVLSLMLSLTQRWCDCVISLESTSKLSEFPI